MNNSGNNVSSNNVSSNTVAFILAAGYSKRIKEYTVDKPKSFLEINNKKLIEYHLENLSKIGIRDIFIVVGFLKDFFKNTIGQYYKDIKITYIDNDHFEVTGHSYSLYLGNQVFKNNNILLIHADVFCDPDLYMLLVNDNRDNVVLVDESYKVLTGDEFLVCGNEGIVTNLGPNRTENVKGEFVGISKFNSDFMIKFCEYMLSYFNKFDRSLNYELLLDRFIKETHLTLFYSGISNKRWVNINYKEDYHIAKQMANEFYKIR